MTEARAKPLVLYVDDEAANRVVFSRTFGARFRVEVVASGEDALARIAEEAPAVLVSDQRMPGMLGTELLTLVKEQSPDTVRVLLTAYTDPEPMLDAINRAGASRYIVKPWQQAEMSAVLEGAIAAFLLQRENRQLQLQLFEAQRFGALGALAASVAHDMASPLSALTSNLERLAVHAGVVHKLGGRAVQRGLVLDESERDACDELADIARESQDSVTYLGSLVAGMRGQARAVRVGEGGDPQRALAYVTALVRGLVVEQGGRLEVEAAESPRVRLPSAELCQVLVNLITNAAHALSRSLPERRISVHARPQDGGVEFRVVDTGMGMTAEQLARAGRERFTTKPEGKGTGLGLPICRAIVERAGGRLEIQSAPERGTQVRIWLPAETSAS